MGLHEKIRELRLNNNISQKKLADAIGVAQSSINYWEKGQRTPSVDAAQRLADYFNITLDELYDINDISVASNKSKKGVFDKFLDILKSDYEDDEYVEYDDIVDKESEFETLQKEFFKNKNIKMQDLMFKLNALGQEKAIEQVELLTKIPEYQRITSEENTDNSEE
ncbi:helix-turn-helix domain-containing protein [Faecalimonas sp. LCP19S3_D12]